MKDRLPLRYLRYSLIVSVLSSVSASVFSQCTGSGNCALQLYGGVVVSMNGGTTASPIIINVAQANYGGIYAPTGASSGVIVSETQGNAINWETDGTGGNSTGNYVYPFGDGMGAYLPLTFAKTTASGGAAGADQVMVATQGMGSNNTANAGGANNAGSYNVTENNEINGAYWTNITSMVGVAGANATTSVIDRMYMITTPTLSGTAIVASITFPYKGWENTTSLPTGDFMAQSYSNSGSAWEYPIISNPNPTIGISPGATIGYVTTVPVTFNNVAHSTPAMAATANTTAEWILSESTSPLPIVLIEFTAVCSNDVVNLEWATASEINNNYFTIQRSADGINYTNVDQVKGAGNSSTLLTYQASDPDPNGTSYYYRLGQTDYDGKTVYSSPVSVNCSGNGTTGSSAALSVFPSPSSGQSVYMKMNGLQPQQQVLVVMINVLGQMMYSKLTFSDSNGSVLEAIDQTQHIPPGVYTVIGSVNNDIYKQKIIVQ